MERMKKGERNSLHLHFDLNEKVMDSSTSLEAQFEGVLTLENREGEKKREKGMDGERERTGNKNFT